MLCSKDCTQLAPETPRGVAVAPLRPKAGDSLSLWAELCGKPNAGTPGCRDWCGGVGRSPHGQADGLQLNRENTTCSTAGTGLAISREPQVLLCTETDMRQIMV